MEKIALLPGGFKPPHAGHYNMAKWLAANTDADSVVIRVGSKERSGITREMSLKLWDLYRESDLDSPPLSILASENNSPVADVYDFIEEEAPEGSKIYLGAGEKDKEDTRYNNIGKFADPKNIDFEIVLVPPQAGGVSGTEMRSFISDGDKKNFQKYLPEHLTPEQKEEAWKIVTTKPKPEIEEDFYDPKNKYYNFAKSSEYKAGMPDGHKEDIPRAHKYKRGGLYTGGGMGFGGMYEQKGGKTLRVYDFDDTLAVTKGANIKVKHKDGSIDTLNPAEFATYTEQEGDKFDFTEFDRVIKDAEPIQNIVSMLEKDLETTAKVTILTARLMAYPVRRYLRTSHDLDAYVVAVGSSDPQDKANWIKKHIEKGYDDILFIDDSEKNRNAVASLKDEYPNIKLDVKDPDNLNEMMGGTMNNQEKRKHKRTLKTIKKDLKKYDKDNKYFEVPKNWKGSLTRKLYENKYYTDNSNIHGIGVFADDDYPENTTIGKFHDILDKGYNFTELGHSHNHSETPNCKNVLQNNSRYMVTIKPVKKGEELTTDYRLQPDLEQPGNFKTKMTPQKDGYRTYSPFKELPYIDVPGNLIDTDNLAYDQLLLIGDNGEEMVVNNNSGVVEVPGANNVREIPLINGIPLTKHIKEDHVPKPHLDDPYDYEEVGPYTTSTALINDLTIPLEVMKTPEDKTIGMMDREELIGGIMYPYDEVSQKDFNTEDYLIPLDIVFINNGTIDTIHADCPSCEEMPCPKYSGLADNVLELPGGFCKQNNINVGDKFNLNLTENKIEENVFTKEWWSKIITENLLTEGGAAGHMAHPFNLPDVNSGSDLKDIFNKSADSLQNNPGSVKIDGVNSSIRLIDLDGEKQFVMDRGSKKELDIKGITKSDLEDRFGDGHGMIKIGGEVLDMFNEALPSLQSDLEKLGAWDNPNILFNMEYVSGKTNVQDYGSNFIAIHGLNQIESKEVQGKRKMLTKRVSSEISYNKDDLQSLLDNLAPIAKERGFEVYGSVPTEMSKNPDFNNALSQNYTIVSNEGEKTQTLDAWLNELNDIPEEDFIFMNVDNSKKKVGAVSKQVYTTLLNGDNIDELFEDENDKQKAIEGFTTYLATEKLGDEILKVLDSPMGSVENHEGVVIRDENIANIPFKITGKFILGGLSSDF